MAVGQKINVERRLSCIYPVNGTCTAWRTDRAVEPKPLTEDYFQNGTLFMADPLIPLAFGLATGPTTPKSAIFPRFGRTLLLKTLKTVSWHL